MRRVGRLVFLFVLALPLMPALAAAQSRDLDWCNGKNGATVDQRIAGCTALYASGRYSGPQLVVLLNVRGTAYRDNKAYDKAMADFDQALRLDPTNANALDNRAETYIYMRDYKRAFAGYEKLIQVAPNDWRGFNGRGVARENLDKKDIAGGIADYEQARRLNPRHPWPLINLCEDHIQLGKTAEALDECAKANELAPSPISFRLLGVIRYKRGEIDAAIAAYDEAIKRSANYDTALYGRGLAKKQKGDRAGAEADIAAALAINAKVADDLKPFGIQ